MPKTNHIMVSLLIWSAKGRWKHTKSCFRMQEHVLKIQPLKEVLEFQDWKRGYKTYTKKKYSNHKLNQLSKIYKIDFANWKTNKQKVKNFVLPSDGSLKAKNALKLFSKYLKERIYENKQYKKSEHSSIPPDISKPAKNFYEKFYTKRQLSKPPLLNFLAKFLVERTYLMNNFTFERLKFLKRYKIYKFSSK